MQFKVSAFLRKIRERDNQRRSVFLVADGVRLTTERNEDDVASLPCGQLGYLFVVR